MRKFKSPYLALWLLLAVGLIVVVLIAFSGEDGILSLKKGTFKDVLLADKAPEAEVSADSLALDSLTHAENVVQTDTTVKSVLIFGDSMTILVANPVAAYGKKNGYDVASVTWDSSTSVGWSSCDTIENFIKRYHPDFIMVTLGSNELFLQNFDQRRPYVEKIVKKIGDIPFVWIGPPNWKEDKGFHDMMERTLPAGTYFRSEGLDLQRGPDHIHPTPAAGVIWTDSIMRWVATKSRHPILAERPDSAPTRTPHHSHYFKSK